MSITENFERALSYVRGDYVCVLGDDDGVTQAAIELARWLKRSDIEVAAVPVATYLWPGVVGAMDRKQGAGMLKFPRYTGKVQVVSMARALNSVLESGGVRIGSLPSVYQGLVSRRALVKLSALAGSCFPGPSPDMANGVGLSGVVDRFAQVSFPCVISGVCSSSGAAEGTRHRHEGELTDRRFLPSWAVERWAGQVPYYFSGPTIWAATVIWALQAIGRQDLVARIRPDRLYGACAVLNPRYRARVREARERDPGRVSPLRFAAGMSWIWTLRAGALAANTRRRLSSVLFQGRQVAGLADIREAVLYVTRTFGPLPVNDPSYATDRAQKHSSQ
jgi:hypothetical protein